MPLTCDTVSSRDLEGLFSGLNNKGTFLVNNEAFI
uniref:Uncharacterized protein n=1 Tax=Anguilla anguilla TaxID=7936 RepID=A0A0E9XJ55_ANGAN